MPPATHTGFAAADAGHTGLSSWLVPTLADRDLFFQDLDVMLGWGSCPSLYDEA